MEGVSPWVGVAGVRAGPARCRDVLGEADITAGSGCLGRLSTWCFGLKGLGWRRKLSLMGLFPGRMGQVRSSRTRPFWHDAPRLCVDPQDLGLCHLLLPTGGSESPEPQPISPQHPARCLARPELCLGAGVGAGPPFTGLLLLNCPHVPYAFPAPLSLCSSLLPGHAFAWNVPEQPATSSRKASWTSQREAVISPLLSQHTAH